MNFDSWDSEPLIVKIDGAQEKTPAYNFKTSGVAQICGSTNWKDKIQPFSFVFDPHNNTATTF